MKNIYQDQFTLIEVEHSNLHLINVTINGQKTKLLIDTGASKSILDISLAEKFNFKYILLSQNQYIGMGGLLDIYIVYDYKIENPFITFLGAV